MSSDAGGRAGQLATSGLRPGWTTGACATAAARAAFVALESGEFPDPVPVGLPQGRRPSFALTKHELGPGWAKASVTKDAGDDPDLTHGAVVYATVTRLGASGGVRFERDEGVGVVTLPGLPLEVGEPAINPMPRQMILDNLAEVAGDLGLSGVGDVIVRIGIENGAELAKHTLNPRLGVLEGLSVLGTTGVVVPYSCSAWIDSIKRGVDVARAAGLVHLGAATGSTSERVARERYGLSELAMIDMGDFVGAVLKYLRTHPVERLSLVGGVGKFAKLADGHLDLHSGRSSVDLDFLAGLAAEAGADAAVTEGVRGASTALGAVAVAAASGVDLAGRIAAAARVKALEVLGDAGVAVDVVVIDRAGAVLAATD